MFLHSLSSFLTSTAFVDTNAICRYASLGSARYDTNPSFAKQTYRAQHIELLQQHIENPTRDLYRCVVSLRALRCFRTPFCLCLFVFSGRFFGYGVKVHRCYLSICLAWLGSIYFARYTSSIRYNLPYGRFRYDINPSFAKQTYRAQHIELLQQHIENPTRDLYRCVVSLRALR